MSRQPLKRASDRLAAIQDKLTSGVKLLAVSKTKPISMIEELYDLGQRDFGENKVQDLLEKSYEIKKEDIQWHFIGHLQSNKVNQLLKVKNLKSIHSIDGIKLLSKILTKTSLSKIGLFLQVNTSGEDEKSGFESTEEIEQAISLFKNNQFFYLQGLMTIGKIRTDDFEKDARASFQKMQELKKTFDEKYKINLELSMGMSRDFKIAQQYGSSWVRIGSDLFGERVRDAFYK